MPATDKVALVAVTDQEFAKLKDLILRTCADATMVPDEDETTIKDIVAHRAHWIDLFLGWYADGQAGKEVFFPAKGYKWNELPRYNADLRKQQAKLSWPAACAALDVAHHRLVEFIRAQDNTALYGGPMKGAKNAWTVGRWAEAAGPSHYRSASKYIRKSIKATQKGGSNCL